MKREIEEQIYIIKVGNLYVINAYENKYSLNLAHASIFTEKNLNYAKGQCECVGGTLIGYKKNLLVDTKEEQTETANDFEVEIILGS